jgi:hypothetical protein
MESYVGFIYQSKLIPLCSETNPSVRVGVELYLHNGSLMHFQNSDTALGEAERLANHLWDPLGT